MSPVIAISYVFLGKRFFDVFDVFRRASLLRPQLDDVLLLGFTFLV